MKRISSFWASGGKRRQVKAWQERDEQLRQEHWQGKTPAECISYERYRKLPAKRRRAIEQAEHAHYQQQL